MQSKKEKDSKSTLETLQTFGREDIVRWMTKGLGWTMKKMGQLFLIFLIWAKWKVTKHMKRFALYLKTCFEHGMDDMLVFLRKKRDQKKMDKIFVDKVEVYH